MAEHIEDLQARADRVRALAEAEVQASTFHPEAEARAALREAVILLDHPAGDRSARRAPGPYR